MGCWLIKYEDTAQTLSDFRPDIECPQWFHDRKRFYRFASRDEAASFWRRTMTKHPMPRTVRVRFVRVVTAKERRDQIAKLVAAIREAHRNLPEHADHARNVLGAAICLAPRLVP